MRLLRTFFLFVCAIGLLSLAGFALAGTTLALPAALGGISCLALAIVRPTSESASPSR
ncbi:MAG: hypothetical protein QOF37_1097 [Thermoleophilaceae bacterium]|jgi:hypothetical protein|nr:hypothetical protein [Thermoleophilaceae bacterium]